MTVETSQRPVALVTGASAGIGAAFATRLAQDGYDLIVTARRQERLEALAQDLQGKFGGKVEVLTADLSKTDGMRLVEKRIAGEPALELLVNNAGFGGYMPFVQLDPQVAEDLINLQVLAVTRLTRAALPGMLERNRGAIINVASRLAFSGPLGSTQLAKRATYAGAKAYVVTFTQLLASELEGTGVKVQVLCPGMVRTEFHTRQGMDTSRVPPNIISMPEDIVNASLDGLKLGEVVCVPTLEDPALLERVMESQRQMFQSSGSGAPAKRYGVS